VVVRYKGREIDPPAIGRELGARMLLSGKVVERSGTLSVQVELVDAAANKQLWGERLHRPLADIFEVEEEITRQIVDKLRLRLSGEQKRQLARRYTENSEAYQLYLKARYHFLKRTPEGLAKGIDYCEQAIAKDADFALAHAALSDCYGVLSAVSQSTPEVFRAKAKARRDQGGPGGSNAGGGAELIGLHAGVLRLGLGWSRSRLSIRAGAQSFVVDHARLVCARPGLSGSDG
jgi:hypothetical protein